MAEPTLQESIWWIIPGQLAGMRQPAADELAILKAEGLGAIVSVMDVRLISTCTQRLRFPIAGYPPRADKPPPAPKSTSLADLSIPKTKSGMLLRFTALAGDGGRPLS
jgi:hypothetical protein